CRHRRPRLSLSRPPLNILHARSVYYARVRSQTAARGGRVPRVATVETPAGLGSALRAARPAKALSLSAVAAATGISPSFLSLVENGKSDITIGRLVRLVTFYGIHLGDLVPVEPAAEPDILRKSSRKTLASPPQGTQIT